jgi:glucose/arabinose dehydrogenase
VARSRPARALALLAAVASVAVASGCGEKEEPEPVGPPTPGPVDPGADIPTGDGDGGVALEDVGEFRAPVFVAQPDGEAALYVVEQEGRIMRVPPRGRPQVFLDITREVGSEGSEQGLLSMAFAPNYERSGRFYVDFTNREGDSRVVEYRRARKGPIAADPDSGRTVLRVAQPFENHNGGLVMFGPDGGLYIGFGDGGSADDPQRNGQNLGTLLGKILRIDPRPRGSKAYGIPAGNPFADRPGARPEIVATGLRNPWRFSFDREGGALWIADVGQSDLEEIDVIDDPEAGPNFGWSAYEGTDRFNEDQEAAGAIEPVHEYGREGGCSVTGGYVVRDPDLTSLYGRYLYADFCAGQLRSFSADGALEEGEAEDDRPLGVQVPAISSFAEDSAGRVYAISLEGPVYRIVAEG